MLPFVTTRMLRGLDQHDHVLQHVDFRSDMSCQAYRAFLSDQHRAGRQAKAFTIPVVLTSHASSLPYM